MISQTSVILKAEDLHLKSGFVAFTTDNAQENYFTDIKIKPLDCNVPKFDPES